MLFSDQSSRCLELDARVKAPSPIGAHFRGALGTLADDKAAHRLFEPAEAHIAEIVAKARRNIEGTRAALGQC